MNSWVLIDLKLRAASSSSCAVLLKLSTCYRLLCLMLTAFLLLFFPMSCAIIYVRLWDPTMFDPCKQWLSYPKRLVFPLDFCLIATIGTWEAGIIQQTCLFLKVQKDTIHFDASVIKLMVTGCLFNNSLQCPKIPCLWLPEWNVTEVNNANLGASFYLECCLSRECNF